MKKPVLLLLAALAGCSSAPSKFYTLDAAPASAAAPRSTGGTPVALGAVNLPGALDRPQFARRNGGNEIDYSETERWAAPLDGMTRRVLAEDLAGKLPPGMVLVADGAGAAAHTVAVDVQRFDADTAGRVTLAARWQVLGPAAGVIRPGRGPARAETHQAAIVEPGGGPGAAAIAAAMSRAVAALAGAIARSLY